MARLTTGGSGDQAAVLSPDGQAVAFTSNRCGRLHIFVMPAAGETDSTGPCAAAGPVDSDGDGIPDAIDPAPATASSAFADGAGT